MKKQVKVKLRPGRRAGLICQGVGSLTAMGLKVYSDVKENGKVDAVGTFWSGLGGAFVGWLVGGAVCATVDGVTGTVEVLVDDEEDVDYEEGG